jgi:hypothetical protein
MSAGRVRARGDDRTHEQEGTVERLVSKVARAFMIGTAMLSLTALAGAQPTQNTQTLTKGAAKVSAMQLKGEVITAKGSQLVVRMIPGGEYRLFVIKPGQTATVDGTVTPLASVAPGTILTASVALTETPVVDRTVTTLTGTVWHAGPTTVVLTLANGENRQYDVPKGMKFDVDGQMKEAMELRPGMKITATKVVEAPRMEVASDSVITGTMKK